MVIAEFESQRKHRIKRSLPNLNPYETKLLLPSLNLEEGIGLNGRYRI